jgi:hypothetical protein
LNLSLFNTQKFEGSQDKFFIFFPE